MRKSRAAAFLAVVCLGAPAGAGARVVPPDAPRADASVRVALERGDEVLDVVVGVRDRVPYGRDLGARPDPKAEFARRGRRLAAQDRIARELGPRFQLRRRYDNFPILAGRATREAVVALSHRGDVTWVTLDRQRHAHQSAPQSSQVLIHSDVVNALGLDGSGLAIAILDTGVDYTVAGMGGGGFPNAKVVGGTDLGDGDPDPMDCEGHGTSVASVAAGPGGVAPGARVVALKIVKTGSCDTAEDSDILAAINWAVTNRDAYGIGVLNLSFGGVPLDGRDHGYCDTALPQYAVAVEAANAAGLVFVASAGNEALTNAVGEPACLSTAISVGAVYPDSYSSVAWQDGLGGTLCADQPVSPDTIVCFSNSASVLSLLAPGAFWLVPTRGGAIEQFHGTSAAAPAAAGSAALLQQARSGIGPAEVASLLRATGRAISDPKSGVLTPRIDALAAVQANPASFAAFDGVAVPIPDASGFASATATVSGFGGTLASVQAVVEIEHADPRQLTVLLTGPDGTSVRLHDRSGTPERPINAVYGKTQASAQSLGAYQGKAANGAWTLSVFDGVPLTTGRIRNFAVRPVAGRPVAPIPPAARSEVLALVGRVQGTKFFLTDARVYNPLSTPQTLSLFYVAQGKTGAQAVVANRTVEPGRVLALNDVVGSEFGYADSLGELTLVGSGEPLLVTSRAYTRSENGTFGLFVPAIASASGLSAGETATANGLSKGARSHTNAGFTELSGSPASVRMDLRRGDGTLASSTTRDVPANGTVLVTDIVGDRGLGAMANFRIDYTVVGGGGRVAPFATFIDDMTGDGVFEAAARASAPGEDLLIAQASHALGGNGDFFRTDLHVTNVGAAPASFALTLLPRLLTGTPAGPRAYSLAPGQTLELPDVLAGEFGLGAPSAAGLRVHPDGSARLVVSSRTYVEKFGGTFGFAIPALSARDALGAGDGAAAVLQLDSTTARSGIRSNFGFAEVSGADAVVRLVAVDGETGRDLGTRLYTVPAGQSFQAALADLLVGAVSNVYLRVSVESGAGRILAYGAAIDNTSGDAVYVPAQREAPIP